MTPHRRQSTRERLVLKDVKITADLEREGWTSHQVGGQLLEESYMGSYKQNNDLLCHLSTSCGQSGP